MPKNEHSDQGYEATRRDVWIAVGLTDPNPLSGPDDPDPFRVNEQPWTEFLIACRIAELHGLPLHDSSVGRVLKRGHLGELLEEMVAEGSLVGHTRQEWSALGRSPKNRSNDILYAHPVLAKMWAEVDLLREEAGHPTEH